MVLQINIGGSGLLSLIQGAAQGEVQAQEDRRKQQEQAMLNRLREARLRTQALEQTRVKNQLDEVERQEQVRKEQERVRAAQAAQLGLEGPDAEAFIAGEKTTAEIKQEREKEAADLARTQAATESSLASASTSRSREGRAQRDDEIERQVADIVARYQRGEPVPPIADAAKHGYDPSAINQAITAIEGAEGDDGSPLDDAMVQADAVALLEGVRAEVGNVPDDQAYAAMLQELREGAALAETRQDEAIFARAISLLAQGGSSRVRSDITGSSDGVMDRLRRSIEAGPTPDRPIAERHGGRVGENMRNIPFFGGGDSPDPAPGTERNVQTVPSFKR